MTVQTDPRPEARIMTSQIRRRAAAAAVVLTALASGTLPAMAEGGATSHTPNAVQRWNDTAGSVALASCISPGNDPLHESRMYAISSLAAHDALNAIDRRYEPYALHGVQARGASAVAAVAAASRTALTAAVRGLPDMFPPECRPAALQVIERAYAAELASVPDGRAKNRGVSVGTAAAKAVLQTRASDGSDTPMIVEDYPQGTKPGEWRFTPDRPFAFAPGWGDVRPFALKGTAGFRVAPPYRLGSAAYARDFAEVKAFGGDGVGTPSARTPDQTEVARFWIESSPLQWNRIARGVATSRGLNSWASARLLALLNMSLADGYIASFSVKYANPFWRPVTAIREAATDGNPATTADPDWTPLDTTPPIPDHDSAHSVQGAAAATVMARAFGTDRVSFRTCSLTLPDGQQCDDATPTLRSYSGFWQAARENANSRVWVGYHFRHATEVGLDHGRTVARLVMDGRLEPVR
jgi:hypothetical protein